MNKLSKFWFVPNTITSLNVFSGCISVVFAFEGNLVLAGSFIMLAAVFDFFDGMSARMLQAYSAMGKELDSLADVISFGLAPAAIVHTMVRQQIPGSYPISNIAWWQFILVFLPFIITIFSALRLAKFNIDTRQSVSFIGLPTPANAMLWAALPFVVHYQSPGFLIPVIQNVPVLLVLSLAMSFLLVSEIPMFSLKFKNLKYSENKTQFIFLLGCLLFLAVFQLAGISIIIIWYILVSLADNYLIKK